MNEPRFRGQTYTLLRPQGDTPSEYEIVTSRLHYYVGRGFEIDLPLGRFYAEHQQKSPFQCPDFEAYFDPRRTTYTSYTRLERDQELDLDARIRAVEEQPSSLSASWLAELSPILGPLRYPIQGLHMVACYVGHMAPSGRITMSALFQAADELRRIDRLAYRTREIQLVHPEFASDDKRRWQRDPAFQPLRELIEHLLVRYDWGEALIALNLCVKPLFDALTTECLARTARAHRDEVLALIASSFAHECAWHEAWSRALVSLVCEQDRAARAAVRGWRETWARKTSGALAPLVPRFSPDTAHFAALERAHTARVDALLSMEDAP